MILSGEGRKDRDSASGVASCCQWWWSCCCCHCSGSFYLNNVVKHAQVLHNIFKSPAPGKNRSYQNVKFPSLFIELMDQDCQILIPTFSLFSKISQTNPSEEVLLRFQSWNVRRTFLGIIWDQIGMIFRTAMRQPLQKKHVPLTFEQTNGK